MSDPNSAEEIKPAKKATKKKTAAKKTAKKAAKKTAKKAAKKVAKPTAKTKAKSATNAESVASTSSPDSQAQTQSQPTAQAELPLGDSKPQPAKSETKPAAPAQAQAPASNAAKSPQNAVSKAVAEAQKALAAALAAEKQANAQLANLQQESQQAQQQQEPQQQQAQQQPKQKKGRVKGHNNPQNRQERQNNQGQNNNQNNNQNNPNNRSKQNPNQQQNKNARKMGKKKARGKKNNNRNQNNNQNNQPRKEKKIELTGPPVEVTGMLELAPKGFGFLRVLERGLEQNQDDVFVTPDLIRTHGLRLGVWIKGEAMQGPRGLQLTAIKTVNDRDPEEARKLPHFEELKAVNPDKRISFETTAERFTTRVVDIIAPVGRGQRGLIVSPPRSGKTTLMMHMAEAIQDKYEETMHLMILLVDERPEEVTEFKHMLPEAEIFASSNDSGAKNHCRVAELCIERAKRLVEAGEHVFVLMDSITRLARAYNTTMGGGKGRGIQSGGIVTGALEMPRRLFAAARNTRTAGSLTIVATALVHTNSKADDAIYQEFKGTGNMELVLDRRIAEQYIYPAVDIFKSGSRREELLLPEISLHKIHLIRRGLAGHRPQEAMERLTFFLKRFNNNAQMLMEIKG